PVRRALGGAVRVPSINRIVDSRRINDVVGAATDIDVGNNQRLGEGLVVQRVPDQQAKLIHVHVRRGQDGLAQVRTGAGVVIVLRQNIHLTVRDNGGRG